MEKRKATDVIKVLKRKGRKGEGDDRACVPEEGHMVIEERERLP